jgi:hypothetical protein
MAGVTVGGQFRSYLTGSETLDRAGYGKGISTTHPRSPVGQLRLVPGAQMNDPFSLRVFGRRRVASGRPGKELASESLRRRNPRERDERLAVYGDLARQELWQGMVLQDR